MGDATVKSEISNAQLSLARTAELLISEPSADKEPSAESKPSAQHYSENEEQTPWGPALRLKPALAIESTPMQWALPACDLGSSNPKW